MPDGNTAALNTYLARIDARTAAVGARKKTLLTDGLGDLVADVVADYSDSVAEIVELLYAGTVSSAEAAGRLIDLVDSEADNRVDVTA